MPCRVCGEASSNGRILRTFCSVKCRNKEENENRYRAEMQLVAHCAQPGEAVLNGDLICKIITLSTNRFSKGRGFAESLEYTTAWWTVCGSKLDYPKREETGP